MKHGYTHKNARGGRNHKTGGRQELNPLQGIQDHEAVVGLCRTRRKALNKAGNRNGGADSGAGNAGDSSASDGGLSDFLRRVVLRSILARIDMLR